MTFEFTEAATFGSGWRRILDTQNRQSDNGFYVDPGNRLHFLVDNFAGPAQQEFADGRIAALALYDGIFIPSPVPEPETAALMLAGLVAVGAAARRRNTAAQRRAG